MSLDMELCGLGLANSYPAVLITAHLYNAGKQLQWIAETWPEIEDFIQLHETTLFGSDIPQTPERIYKCYLLKIGVKATAWARNRRQNEIMHKGTIPVLQPNQTFDSLRKHYVGEMPINRCLHELRAHVQKSKSIEPIEGEGAWAPLEMLAGIEKLLLKELQEIGRFN